MINRYLGNSIHPRFRPFRVVAQSPARSFTLGRRQSALHHCHQIEQSSIPLARSKAFLHLNRLYVRKMSSSNISEAVSGVASVSLSSPPPPELPFSAVHAPSPFITARGPPLEHLLDGYEVVAEKDGLPSYAVFKKEIQKSPNDDRLYRLILLENGLEALIIEDSKTDKSAASMDVKVGHLNDPEDLQGLAHFCEHLMFMGTEKYPKENEYTEFLTQNSGSSNAFTGMDQTCYYFDVHPDALAPALDRFAQFFISPKFDPSCTEREANAVNSENDKNLQSDQWRMFQLDKSTSSKDHVFWRFGTGNRDTLYDEPKRRGIDVRERLMEWQRKYYSANLMKLVVLAKEPLDETTKTIVEKFSAAPNRQLSPPEFNGSPYSEKELATTIYLKTVKDTRSLELSFPFPDESPLYASKPGSFLSHLIGHEGPGSVLSYLKAKGWANHVSVGSGNGANGFEFFKINIDLTKNGLEHHEDVTAAVFQYIDLLKSTPPQEWAFTEMARLNAMGFQFKEKSPPTQTAMGLSLQMSKPYPRDLLLSAPWLSSEWNADIIEKSLQWLAPERCRVMIGSKDVLHGQNYDLKEQWYGTEYTIAPISEKILKGGGPTEASGVEAELAFPQPNSFIPTDLAIKAKTEVEEPAKRPLSLRNTPISRLWYKKDDRWWVPRAGAFFLLRSPLIDNSPRSAVQSRLFTELIRDSLVEYSYDAELAGLSYTFDSQADGILLTIDGYNDKLPVLAKVVLDKIKNLKVDPKRFELIVDQLKRAFVNFRLEQPYSHAAFNILHLTQETLWTHEERLAELESVTPESLQEYIGQLLLRIHIETLVHGNVLKDDAVNLAKLAETTLAPSPLSPKELLSHRALVVPEGKHLYQSEVANPENVNSAIEQFTYVGDIQDQLERVKLSVFGTIVSEPLFDQLRTKEQLGYIVSSGARKSIGFMGLRVIVQSDRDAAYIETRLDAFWDSFKTTLADMSEEEFEKYKTSVINRKLEDHKNMWQESSHLWINIHTGYYDFLHKEKDAALIKTLKKSDIVEFFSKYFFDSASHRIRRLSVHTQAQRVSPASLAALLPSFQEQLDGKIDEAKMHALVASKPTVAVVQDFAKEALKENGKSEDQIEAYFNTIEAALGGKLPEGVDVISDADMYRKKATPAPYAEPIAEYSDLFPARL